MKSNLNAFFEDNAEIEIYKYVCGKGKKCIQSYNNECLNDNINSKSWKGWKNHVNKIVNSYTAEEKEELLHYLINKQRYTENVIGIITGFVSALFAAIGASVYIEFIKDVSSYVVSIILALLCILLLYFVLVFIATRYQCKNSFYLDYIKILEEMLGAGENDHPQTT